MFFAVVADPGTDAYTESICAFVYASVFIAVYYVLITVVNYLFDPHQRQSIAAVCWFSTKRHHHYCLGAMWLLIRL